MVQSPSQRPHFALFAPLAFGKTTNNLQSSKKQKLELSISLNSTFVVAKFSTPSNSASIRLCVTEADNRGIFDKTVQCRGTLAKAIYMTMMNTLIPYVKVSLGTRDRYRVTLPRPDRSPMGHVFNYKRQRTFYFAFDRARSQTERAGSNSTGTS